MKLLFLCAAAAFASQDVTPPKISLDLGALDYSVRDCNGHPCTKKTRASTSPDQVSTYHSATCEVGSTTTNCPLPRCVAFDHHDFHCKNAAQCGHLTGNALAKFCLNEGSSNVVTTLAVGEESGSPAVTDGSLATVRNINSACTHEFACQSTFTPINDDGQVVQGSQTVFTDVDRNLRSEWVVKFDASDRSGNAAESVSFTMIFQDTQAPSLNTEFCDHPLPTHPQHRDHNDHDTITVVSGMGNTKSCSGSIERKFAQACTERQDNLNHADVFPNTGDPACTHRLLAPISSFDKYDKDVATNMKATLTSPLNVETQCTNGCDLNTKILGDWVIAYESRDNAGMFGWREDHNRVYQTVTIQVRDTRPPHIYIQKYDAMSHWTCDGDDLHPIIECQTGNVYADPKYAATCEDLRESWAGGLGWQHEQVTADAISHVNIASLNTATPDEFECDGGSSVDDVPAVCVNQPIDIAFVLDSSGSIRSSRFTTMKQEVSKIVQGLDVSATMVQVAAHAYSSQNDHLKDESGFNLNEHYGAQTVMNEINALPFHGRNTWTGTAIEHTVEQVLVASKGKRANVPTAMIIVTDGKPTGEASGKAKLEAEKARAAGIKVFAIGVGGTYNEQNLKDMASEPHSEHVYKLDNFDVADFKKKLLTTICTEASSGSNNNSGNGAYDCSLQHEASFEYTDAGAVCSDAIDGSVSYTTINPVNVEVTGTYVVTYRAENTVGLWNDGKNNAGTADVHTCLGGNQQYFRTVHVIDTLKPKIVVKYQGTRVAAGVAQDKAVHNQALNPASQYMAEEAGGSMNAWTLCALASAAAGIALVAQSHRRTEVATSVPV